MASAKYFDWNTDKTDLLKAARGISFEEILTAIAENRILDVIEHPNKAKDPHQFIYIVDVNHYAYAVPFVDNGDNYLLKTIIPSREYTKKYLRKEQ